AAFADLCTLSLLDPALENLLAAACRLAAEGCAGRYATVLEHVPAQRRLLLRAGWGWQPGVVGRIWIADDGANPASECLQTKKPVVVGNLAQRYGAGLPPLYVEQRIVAAATVPIGEPGRSCYGGIRVGST